MERSTKKLKTIKMKYPAQYSHSWNEEKLIKPKKTGKEKKTHAEKVINYEPMIYSRSWPKEKVNKKPKKRPDSPALPLTKTQIVYQLPFSKMIVPTPQKKIARTRKAVNHPRRSNQKVNRAIDPFSEARGSTKEARLPDPTAPHLKYGLFPPIRRGMNNAQAQVLLAGTGTACKPTRSATSSLDFFSRTNKRKRHSKAGKADDSHNRLFMFQPTGSRRLTISTPTHLDIRPRYYRIQESK